MTDESVLSVEKQPSRGRFIVLEGLEGAGKSTAISTIKRFLTPLVPELIITREPGGTSVGEAVREILKAPENYQQLNPEAELLLFYASRTQLVQQVILPALQRGAWVLADRFELSTFAYQGGGRKLDMDFIQALSDFSLHGLKPDLTIFLDIHPEIGLQRAVARGKIDRIESESIDFFNTVYDSYHEHLKKFPLVHIIDASKPLGEVQYLIKTVLNQFLALDYV